KRTIASTCSGSETSVRTNAAEPPRPRMASTAVSPSPATTSAMTTCAPSDAKSSAATRPIPPAAPVISATLPSSRPMCVSVTRASGLGRFRSTGRDVHRPAVVRLATWTSDDAFDDVELTRNLVTGNAGAAVLLHTLECWRVVGIAWLDDDGDPLAPSIVTHADDRAIEHRGMRLHRRFDF